MHHLVYNDPDDPVENVGVGWTLVNHLDTARYTATSLAAYGAGAHATLITARAVAEQNLNRRGVTVAGWSHVAEARSGG